MSLIQGYNGQEVHKENAYYVLKSGDKIVGTYDTMADLVAANPRRAAKASTKKSTAKTSTKTSTAATAPADDAKTEQKA